MTGVTDKPSVFGDSQEPCGVTPARTVEQCAPPSQNGRTCAMCGAKLWKELAPPNTTKLVKEMGWY